MTTIPAVRFVPPGQAWHTLFDWRRYDAVITGDGGRLVYEQRGVEFPVGWDQNSVNIVAQKYFWGDADKGEREWSLRQLVDRVVGRIADWAARSKVLPACGLDEASFVNELGYLIASQRFSFNSPVLFNVGVDEQPQTSACFILSVKDTMTSIAENVMTEMMIFKHGSGAGSNRGSLRSKREKVRGGGRASGPMSFIRVYDAAAGGIKSGGKTRRAAKMEILDVDHLDVREFVTFKRDEERKAKLLVAAGVDGSFCGEAYSTVSGQNANYSVRVTDEFMRAVEAGGRFTLRGRKQVELTEEIDARDLWRLIAQCAHDCADPGVQFDGEIQRMHTCANDGPIRATNPCSEYVFLDDTSCNLSSHNLLSYLDPATKKFDAERFRYAVALSAVAMDAVIDFSSFPTPAIENGTRRYRTLGIGFTGLGALLMNLGLSYDSDAGRFLAGSITSLMTAQAYLTSAEMARHAGAFAGYAANREPFGGVLDRHATAAMRLTPPKGVAVDDEIVGASRGLWQAVQQRALSDEGFRNAQVTVLAPTGTISFLMGMQASTGVEPVLGLVTHKNLAGGGSLRQVNPWVDAALAAVGSPEDRRKRIVARIEECGSPVDPRWTLRPEERAVLLTAFADPIDGSALPWSAHVAMMASCQPFLSGAISKTVNLPETATVEDIMTVYRTAWERGLKCIAVYRDNSKGVQAVGTSAKSTASVAAALDLIRGPAWGERRKLPMTRKSVTTKFAIGPEERLSEGFLIVGLDDENQPKELFVQFNNVGGTVQGLVHGWAKAASYALQLGLPLHDLIDMALHTRFEPLGPTRNPDIPSCSSLLDFVVKWLLLQFDLPEYKRRVAGARPVRGVSRIELAAPTPAPVAEPAIGAADHDDQPLRPDHDPCSACGAIMVVAGSCRVCTNCGTTTGCG